MAMINAPSETSICNMALARIGSARIVDIEDDSEDSVQTIQCRLHYSQTRDALIRSHWWRMARARATLSQNAAYNADDNTFEWNFAYDLPVDFLRMKKPWDGFMPGSTDQEYSYSPEWTQLLSDQTTLQIQYIKRVTDVTKFDPLFTEVFVLTLAMKMTMPLAGAGKVAIIMRNELSLELDRLMMQVRVIDKQETNTQGRIETTTWNDAMRIGQGIWSGKFY